MKKYTLTILTLMLIAFTSFAQSIITNHQAFDNMRRDSTIQLLDVRTATEFQDKHIQKALNIDWKNQENFIEQLNQLNKNKPVYVYCLSGGRSQLATAKLAELGFNVYDIEGGILKWQNNNLPIMQSKVKTESKELSIEEYQSIIKNNQTVLVVFYAPWCGPCQTLAPIINDLANSYQNRVKVIRINIDENNRLYKDLNITGIPMLLIYKNGVITWSNNGLVDKKIIENNF